MGKKFVTVEGRAAFANQVFEPKAIGKGTNASEPKYGLTLLFSPEADLKPLKALAKKVAEKKWPGKSKTTKFKYPIFFKGNSEDYEGFAGTTYIHTSRNMADGAPGVVDSDMNEILSRSDFYSGCYCIISLECWAWENEFGKGISFTLCNIKKTRDGERLDNIEITSPEDDFNPNEQVDSAPLPPKAKKKSKPKAEPEPVETSEATEDDDFFGEEDEESTDNKDFFE